MVKDGLFKRFSNRKKNRLSGDSFLIQLDKKVGQYYRNNADSKQLDANKYLAQILTQAYKNETKSI